MSKSLSDFRAVSKTRKPRPTTIVDVVRESAATVVRTYANRQCGCSGCSGNALQSLHSLSLAVIIRHAHHGATDDEAALCMVEIHRATQRILAIEDFCLCPIVEGRMQ